MSRFKYEYYFVPHGTTRESLGYVGNEVWLDVGNKIEKGTFDHHGRTDEMIESTVGSLFYNSELLKETIDDLNIEEKLRLYLHREPDTDTLFAAYLFQYFADGDTEEIERFKKGSVGKKVIQFVDDIDSGNKDNVNGWTLYKHICKLDHKLLIKYWGTASASESFNRWIETGIRWVKKAIERLKTDESYDLKKDELLLEDDEARIIRGELTEADVNSIIRERIEAEKENSKGYYEELCYDKDKKQGKLFVKNIEIWTTKGQKEVVKAAIWNDIPTDPDSSYLLARNEGAVVTFVPQNVTPGTTGVMVSVEHETKCPQEGSYSLIEVGELYELMEQIYDKDHLGREGALRRSYSRPRGDGKSKVFNKAPFSYTSDPWYVSNKYDMVASPRVGSRISISQMIGILETITRMIKQTYIVSFILDTTKMDAENETPALPQVKTELNDKSLFSWCRTVKEEAKQISDKGRYPLVIAEVDSQLLTYSYEILNAVFMNLSDGAYLDADKKSVLRLDYRTHIFINQGIAVIFVATSDSTDNRRLMDGMLDISGNHTVSRSKIIGIFSKNLYQREKYKEIGEFIGEFNDHKKDLKRKRKELILLLAKAQAYECFDTQVELDSYKFIANALNVSELKESVKESMEMVSEYSQERVYGRLDLLSRTMIPYVIIGTLFQIGAIRFGPVLDIVAEKSNVAWEITSLLTIAITMLLIYFGRE